MAEFDLDLQELARTEPSGMRFRLPPSGPPAPPDSAGMPNSRPFPSGDRIVVTPGALDGDRILLARYWGDALTLAAFSQPAIGLGSAMVPDWLETACAGRDLILALDRDLDINGWRSEMEYRLGRQAKSCRVIRPAEGLTWMEWLKINEDGLRAFLSEKLGPAPSR